jgi:dTMP kinase
MAKNTGKLIVIEGTDGSGKATQFKLLQEHLKRTKTPHSYFDFPQYNSTFFGRFVGELLHGKLGDLGIINSYLISVPYAADRWQAKPKLEEALTKGKLVICNRYAPSNLAYQLSRVKPKERVALEKWLTRLEYYEFGIPKEDLVIFLYVPFSFAQALIDKKNSRRYLKGKTRDLNEENLELLKTVDVTYLWLLKRHKNWVRIDCV